MGAVAGVYSFFRGFRFLGRKRLIENIPTSKIRGAAMGPLEVCGKIIGPYTLISPLSQLDCFYYRATIWISPENKRRWTKVAEEAVCVPFFVEDGTGRLMVDPSGAELELACDFEGADVEAAHVRPFLERHGLSPVSSIRLEERCIHPSDTLFVLGVLGERLRERLGNLDLEGSRVVTLSREAADLQRRGALEAMHVRVPEYDPAISSDEEKFDTSPPVLLQAGDHKEPFFISQNSQRRVLEELEWKTKLYVWGGPVLALVSLGILLDWLGLW